MGIMPFLQGLQFSTLINSTIAVNAMADQQMDEEFRVTTGVILAQCRQAHMCLMSLFLAGQKSGIYRIHYSSSTNDFTLRTISD